MSKAMDELCVNTIRTLAMDAVQRAKSGHPGTPMALAPVVYCLWQRVEHPDYREQVLPDAVTARVSVEQGATLGWTRYVGRHGHSIGMETFGASAPLKELQKKFGFVPENVIAAAKAHIASARR
jgi:transketolase